MPGIRLNSGICAALQVLDEIGVDMSSKMGAVPTGKQAQAQAAAAAAAADEDREAEDLLARLTALKN